jgi:hypothetical protein
VVDQVEVASQALRIKQLAAERVAFFIQAEIQFQHQKQLQLALVA